MEKLSSIPGLDMITGIQEHGGNQENYFKVLRSYLVSTKTKLEILENALEGSLTAKDSPTAKDSLKQYEITVHGIKGSSRNIYAQDIGNKAAELEKAAEAGNIEFITVHNPPFLEELKKMLNGIEEMFNGIDSKIIKQKKDKPDKQLLIKLMEACDIYDMMEAEAAIAQISKYQYDSDDGLAEWLKHCCEGMQYDQIVEKLRTVLSDTIQ